MANKNVPSLPVAPHVGLTFRPDTTDSVGTVLGVTPKRVKGRVVHDVTYSYAHEPEVTYSRPYSEVRAMAWPL